MGRYIYIYICIDLHISKYKYILNNGSDRTYQHYSCDEDDSKPLYMKSTAEIILTVLRLYVFVPGAAVTDSSGKAPSKKALAGFLLVSFIYIYIYIYIYIWIYMIYMYIYGYI